MLDRIYFAFPGQDVTLAHYWTDTRMAVLRMNKTDEYERASRLPWNTLPGYVSYSYVTNVLNIAMAVIAEPAYYPHGTMAMLHGGVLFLFAAQLGQGHGRPGPSAFNCPVGSRMNPAKKCSFI
ncbi:hypothetical protein MRX96_031878 [Rhipicephalus microplus]